MNIFEKVKKFFNKRVFELYVSKIQKTPPIECRSHAQVTIVTMLGHTQVSMFILALKSFIRFYPNISLDILDDTTLTDQDYKLLSSHFLGVNIIRIDVVDTENCPKRNCWERLVYIVNKSKDSYIIQLDSDTLTIGPCVDVYAAIDNNHGFVIGGGPWISPISTKNMSNIATSWKSNHIQPVSERVLGQLESTKNLNYLRGCAAFCGFPKGSLNMEWLNKFSDEMEAVIGKDRWNEWGSEQLASNILLSKTNNAFILPWPRYQNYMEPGSDDKIENSNFIHFIGSQRYNKGTYSKLAKKIIKQLS